MPKIDTLYTLEEHEEHDDDYQTVTNWNANWYTNLYTNWYTKWYTNWYINWYTLLMPIDTPIDIPIDITSIYQGHQELSGNSDENKSF